MKNKLTIFYLSIIFFSFAGILIFFNNYDNDFNISFFALLNVLLILLIIYIVLVFLTLYNSYQNNKLIKQQKEVFKDSDYIIDEFENEEILILLHNKLNGLKQNIASANSRQDKWVHDIKIPLATLRLFIENKRKELSSEDIRILELIALDIENDINKKIVLDKIEAEIDDYHIENINLKEVVTRVIKKFRPSFLLKNLRVNVSIDDIFVVSDSKSLEYCFEQIIANAIKYSFEDTEINIYMQGNSIVFEDNGLEIALQDSNRIYEFGYTGSNSINKGMESTGIGLYMVKKSLDALGHSIVITSDDNIVKVMIGFNKIVTKKDGDENGL